MFNKRAQDVTFADLESFCRQNVPENSWLDYKENFYEKSENEQIGKIISAFANSHGGWLLLGVGKAGKDPLGRDLPGPLTGIESSALPAERVKAICLNAIYPPVMPEIGVFPLPSATDSGKVFVVVHVFESDSTPHTTSNDRVYIRTGDVSVLEQDGRNASIEEIEMLLNRREKSLLLKKRLLERAAQRKPLNPDTLLLSVYCVPTYPTAPITDLQQLPEIARSSARWAAFSDLGQPDTAHESVFRMFNRNFGSQGALPSRAEFNIYGLVYYNARILADRAAGRDSFDAFICLTIISCVLNAAEAFYKKVDYAGLVDLAVQLKNQRMPPAVLRVNQGFTVAPRYGTEIADSQFLVEHRTHAHLLNTRDVVIRLVREFLWAAGYGELALTDDFGPTIAQLEQYHQINQSVR